MTITITDWHCRCGTFNKASWSICPTCGVNREDLAPPTPQQLAVAREKQSVAARRRATNALHGVFGAVVLLALLAGIAFGGWKGWQYAEKRWFDSTEAAGKESATDVQTAKPKPPNAWDVLATHTLLMPAGAKPYYDKDVPRNGRISVSEFFGKSKSDRAFARSLGIKAIYGRAWQRGPRRAFVVTMQMRDSTGPKLLLEGGRQEIGKDGERRFSTGIPGAVGATGKNDEEPGYLTAVVMARGSRLAMVFVGTRRPATKADLRAVKALAKQQYNLL